MAIAPDPSQAAVPVSAEEALCRIVEGTGATTGRDFFRSLVRHLAGALGMLVVMHDRPVDGGPGSASTVPQTHGILRLFAGRAAAELQRLRREDQLRAAYASLEQAHASLARAHAQLRETERRHRDRAE